MTQTRLPLLANAYGIPHAWGLLSTAAGEFVSAPVEVADFAQWSLDVGLAGIDIPWESLDSSPRFLEQVQIIGLRVVLEAGVFLDLSDPALDGICALATRVDARVVRFLLSRNLCGDRTEDPLGWNLRMCRTVNRLRRWLPRFADANVSIALENHQDGSVDDFLWLAEAVGHHPAFGVCFDTGNPLAVGEDPIDSLRRLGSLVRHVHLKDYRMIRFDAGYRLVRCVAGQGVIDFRKLLAMLDTNPDPNRWPSIEIAAQRARDIPVASEKWLAQWNVRRMDRLGAVLSTWSQHAEPDSAAWKTEWELGLDSRQIVESEWKMLESSVRYFRSLFRPEEESR